MPALTQIQPRFRDTSAEEAWKTQLQKAVRTLSAIEAMFSLSDDEKRGLSRVANGGMLPFQITPHYLSLINSDDPDDPLRRQLFPLAQEFQADPWMKGDPLGEEDLEAVPFLVHRYPDRVLLLVTDRCASYCRFCTRKRMVGQGPTPKKEELSKALQYIAEHPEIREVIFSGGDALTLDDQRLEKLFIQLREMPHIQIIRIATRMLSFAPMRITDNLIRLFQAHQPVYILSHFNHLNEVGSNTEQAILKLVNAGVPVLNQTVLLKGVNDDVQTLSELFRKLTCLRARPYYLHQCDLAHGTAHFRVPLEEAQDLVEKMRGQLSGLCQPTFVIDIPGGHGKVPMFPSPVTGQDDKRLILKGFKGTSAPYPLR
ncbi:MAG: KamA family radical SAM protein [Deltaproteobacteria bacterium]|nr:KamA family radical SAM protein [Deltaproteobacteria bacterium]